MTTKIGYSTHISTLERIEDQFVEIRNKSASESTGWKTDELAKTYIDTVRALHQYKKQLQPQQIAELSEASECEKCYQPLGKKFIQDLESWIKFQESTLNWPLENLHSEKSVLACRTLIQQINSFTPSGSSSSSLSSTS